ncbi:MAG: LEPR-XLL domain-containing protein, partial [Mesorhizobium sp.]
MAFPFKSEGITGRPISHRRAKLSEILKAKLARLARGSRVQRELADRVRLVFDPLEPRLLLNADLNVNLATDGPSVDHEILVRLFEEVQAAESGTPAIQRVQIIDQTNGGKVLAFGDLGTINSISIIGGSGNDTLRIDEDSFGGNTLPKVISFYGGDGDDNVVFDSSFDISSKVAWTLDGDGAGSVRGTRVGVDFHETENLRGSDDNEDTFTIKAAGSLAGTIDGGFGGNDTIVYDGVTAVADSAVLGANGSGSVGLNNHSTLVFENMEPFAVGGGVTIEDHSGAAKGKDVAITVSDGKLHLSIGGGPAQAITSTGKVWLYLGEDAGKTTIASLPDAAGLSLMVDARDEIAVEADAARLGHLGLSAAEINIGPSASIRAESIDIRAVDWARSSLDAAAAGATLSATKATSATVTIAGSLSADGTVNISSQVSNTVKAHGSAQADLRTIEATLTNVSSVTLAGTASVTGASIDIAASTAVDVDLAISAVPIPNLLGLTEVVVPDSVLDLTGLPQDLRDQIEADDPNGDFNTASQAFSDALGRGEIAMEDLATMAKNVIDGFGTSQVSSKVDVTNTTAVSIDATSRVTQTGNAGGVQVAAADDSRVAVMLQTEKDDLIPAAKGIVVFSAISSDTDIDRTTSVTVGQATGIVSAKPTTIDAQGDVAIGASSTGEVRNAIVSNALGATTNVATDKTAALVRGVTVKAGGLMVSAGSDTTYSATSLDSENRVTGETSATVAESVIDAGAGGVSVLAGDYSTFIAIANPFQPRLDASEPAPSAQVARVSVINMVNKTTSASISQSDVDSEGTVTVSATNQTNLLAYSSTAPVGVDADTDTDGNPVVVKNAVAGVLAVNVVNGSTTAAIESSTVTTTGAADVAVTATDDSFVDATIYVNIDGRGPVGLGMASSNAVTGLEALNVIGFDIGTTAADLARATLDTILGTTFWTHEQPVKVSAAISDSVVAAAGALMVMAVSKGVVNSTVSNVARNVAEGGVVSSSAKSIGGVLASNQVSRLASATINGGTTSKAAGAGGDLVVSARDDTTINSNTKIATGAITSSDGGLHALSEWFDDGQKPDTDRLLTDGRVVSVAYGTTVGLDYDVRTDGYTGAIDVKTGDIVYVSALGSSGHLYKYNGPDAHIDFDHGATAVDFSTDDWVALSGIPGQTYTYLGADNLHLDLTDPGQVDFTDVDLWKAEPSLSILTDGTNIRATGGTAIGAAIVFNDVRGGATALIDKAMINAASVSVTADSTGSILADADVFSEAQGGGPFNQDSLVQKALGSVKGFLFKAGGTNAQAAMVATNLIQGETSAKIVNSKLGTSLDKVGDVTVWAENRSLIDAHLSTVAMAEGNSAGAFQIANNTIGWERGNFLFNTVETLLGDVVADVAGAVGDQNTRLRTENPFVVEASITGGTVASDGDVLVNAVSGAMVASSIDNEASANVEALFDGAATGYAAVISGNKVSSAAKAFISGGTVQAGTVAVQAADSASIDATTGLGVSSQLDNSNGVNIVNKIAARILDDYDYTTKSGTPHLNLGDTVRISEADDYAGTGEPGAVYQYMGPDGAAVDLATANFDDFGLWKKLNTDDLIPASIVKSGLLAAGMSEASVSGDASGLGGIFDRNQVKSEVTAQLTGTVVTAAGAVSVTADESATISATDTSVVDSWGAKSGISVSNTVLGGASASVGGSSVTTGGDLTVSAASTATIDATALSQAYSSGDTYSFVLAFNAVGYQPQNLLFDAIDTLIGSPEISQVLGEAPSVQTTAFIADSSIDVGGDIAVSAVNEAGISATTGNESKMEWNKDFAVGAKSGVSGLAAGGILASNKVSADASAYIDNTGASAKTVKAGGGVGVEASNAATISADISVVSTALPASTVDALKGVVSGLADQLGLGSYDYTTKSGVRTVEKGDKVRVALDYDDVSDGVNEGAVYEYTGGTPFTGDLATVDYSTGPWKQLETSDYEDIFFPNVGNVVKTNGKAIGLSIAYNDTRGDAQAYIKGATVAANGGDVDVAATGKSTITAYTTNTVEAGGGSGITGKGDVLGFSGQIDTNVVLGKTSASIENSTVTASGDVSVSADNEARIDARLYSTGLSGATAVGVTLAYNSVGWEAQNLLFNTLDTLIGSPYLADDAFDGNVGADATASILKSSVGAGGDIAVSALNNAQINATVSNAAVTDTASLFGASGSSYGAVISGNKVSGAARAIIDNSGTTGKTIAADGTVSVTADDSSGIYSNVKLVAETSVTNDGGASIIQETINDLAPADYDTNPDPDGTKVRNLKYGDRVRLADDYAGNVVINLDQVLPPSNFSIANGDMVQFAAPDGEDSGPIYQYTGADGTIDLEALADAGVDDLDPADWTLIGGNAGSIYIFMGKSGTYDLAATDFTDLGLWKEDPKATILLQDLNLKESPSQAVGGLIVMNDVRGGADASIKGAAVSAASGDVQVLARESAGISAKVDSSISASGGSSIDWDGDGKTDGKNGKPKDTDPGTDHKPGSDADPANPVTPDDPKEETPEDKVLAINGTIATNIVQSSATATISDSEVTSAGDVSVTAENTASIEADTQSSAYTSGGDTAGVTLAFNSIGYGASNVLFNGVDALLGDNTITNAFGLRNPAMTAAAIVDSDIDAAGDVSVTADNKAVIDASVGNESTSSSTSISGTDGKAFGFILALNKIASESSAVIDNSGAAAAQVKGPAITVSSADDAAITAEGNVLALAEIKNDYGASIVANLINSALGSYQFTTKSGSQTVHKGDLVYIDDATGLDGPAEGEKWVYNGPDGATVDLSGIDFSDGNWSKFIAEDIVNWINDNLVPSLAGGDAIAAGGIATLNSIDSGASARVTAAEIVATGNMLVSALQSGMITANTTARVEATGSAKGKSIAVNGVIATNNVVGHATALVDGSAVAGADLDVTARSDTGIDATIDADTIAKGTAAGITLAFNTIGLKGQNFLFNAVDTLVGTNLVDTIYGHDPDAQVSAKITGSTTDLGGDLTVSAVAAQTIDAKISNYVKTVRGGPVEGGSTSVSVGGVFALNRVINSVEAVIEDSDGIDAGGLVTVSAINRSEISSYVVSPVISIDYTYGESANGKSFAIGLVVSRNAIDVGVTAKIDGVSDMDAGAVTVEAVQEGKIDATAAAAAVSVAAGTGSGLAVGVAGTIAFNTILGSASALIQDSDVQATAAVTVSAANSADIDATIAAAAASVAGGFNSSGTAIAVGIVLAFNYVGYSGSIAEAGQAKPLKTEARIRNSSVDGSGVGVSATSDQTIDAFTVAGSVAVGLSGSGNGITVSAGGVFVQNSIAANTTAAIDSGENGNGRSTITAGDDGLDVEALNTSEIHSTAAAASLAASLAGNNAVAVSIGLAVALNDIKGSVAATISQADIASDGAVSVKAGNEATIEAIGASASVAASLSPNNSVAVSGAGAAVTNIVDVDTEASVSNSNITKSGGVDVEAVSNSSITAKVLTASAALAGGNNGVGASIGASVAVNRIGDWSVGEVKDTKSGQTLPTGNATLAANGTAGVRAFISNTAIASDGAVTVDANSSGSIHAEVLAGSVAIAGGGTTGVGVSVAGVYTLNFVAVATQAYIADASSVSADSISIAAKDATTIEVLAGAASLAAAIGGTTGVGVSIGFAMAQNRIENNVAAYLENADSVKATAGGVVVSAENAANVHSTVATASVSVAIGGTTGISFSGGGAVALNTIATNTNAFIEASDIKEAGSVSVTATNSSTVKAETAAVSLSLGGGGTVGGAASFGAAVAVNEIGHGASDPDQVQAYVRGSSIKATGALTVTATSSGTIDAIVAAGSAALGG